MRFRGIIVSAGIAAVLIYSALTNSFAAQAEIKSAMKILRQGAYIILINYETHEAWTDNIVFRVQCKFDEGDFAFTSASLNNISKGWHKTEIAIPDAMKKRYGSLKEYKIELYSKGMLIDTRDSY